MQFKAEVTGTYWYHAHMGSESGMGAHGGFVVHPRHRAFSRYHRQFTLLVEDWNHDWDSTMDFLKMQVIRLHVWDERLGVNQTSF